LAPRVLGSKLNPRCTPNCLTRRSGVPPIPYIDVSRIEASEVQAVRHNRTLLFQSSSRPKRNTRSCDNPRKKCTAADPNCAADSIPYQLLGKS
jgi:hypothetical protein